MKHFLGTMLVGAVLATPVFLRADDHDRDKHERDRVARYYDRDAKDWHEWNEAEARAYHRWWEERRHDRDFRDFNRLNARERAEYWHWRHEHRDLDDRR
jgi:hypothetical protein